MDAYTQEKWDRISKTFDLMSRYGPELRWRPAKRRLFANMRADARILFVALGTGLDIPCFPAHCRITAIDISPQMVARAGPRLAGYDGEIEACVADVNELDYPDEHFDQVFTSCTFCSVPDPIAGLSELRRVLRTGGDLYMFEHTGSRWFPFSVMMDLMTPLTSRVGPDMNRRTVDNVRAAGFELKGVYNVYLDVVKTIHAVKPAA
jgi:ubiquinone/menaquinone biosynthesis C-methylase UbiE